MTTILFYFLIILALAGSSYYGWRSAKSAKNRQETQEQNDFVVFSCSLMSSFLRAF